MAGFRFKGVETRLGKGDGRHDRVQGEVETRSRSGLRVPIHSN